MVDYFVRIPPPLRILSAAITAKHPFWSGFCQNFPLPGSFPAKDATKSTKKGKNEQFFRVLFVKCVWMGGSVCGWAKWKIRLLPLEGPGRKTRQKMWRPRRAASAGRRGVRAVPRPRVPNCSLSSRRCWWMTRLRRVTALDTILKTENPQNSKRKKLNIDDLFDLISSSWHKTPNRDKLKLTDWAKHIRIQTLHRLNPSSYFLKWPLRFKKNPLPNMVLCSTLKFFPPRFSSKKIFLPSKNSSTKKFFHQDFLPRKFSSFQKILPPKFSSKKIFFLPSKFFGSIFWKRILSYTLEGIFVYFKDGMKSSVVRRRNGSSDVHCGESHRKLSTPVRYKPTWWRVWQWETALATPDKRQDRDWARPPCTRTPHYHRRSKWPWSNDVPVGRQSLVSAANPAVQPGPPTESSNTDLLPVLHYTKKKKITKIFHKIFIFFHKDSTRHCIIPLC